MYSSMLGQLETQAFISNVTFKCYGADKTATADPFSPALCVGS